MSDTFGKHGVEEFIGGEYRLRVRAWMNEKYDGIEFELAAYYAGEWTPEVDGSFRANDECANFNNHTEPRVVHTCGFDGFTEWCDALARVPELVKQVRAKAWVK